MTVPGKRAIACVLALALLATGCARPPPRPDSDAESAAPGFQREGARLFEFDTAVSKIRVRVYRGGPLASLGHNHVIAVEQFGGQLYLQDELRLSGFELSFRLEDAVLDRPADRAAEGEGFESELSREDIAATRHNMLDEEGLEANRYPEASVRSLQVRGQLPEPVMTLRVSLHGVTRNLDVPVRLSLEDDITASGAFSLRQTDFGIRPYRAALGALVVQDEIDVRFRLVAVPADRSE